MTTPPNSITSAKSATTTSKPGYTCTITTTDDGATWTAFTVGDSYGDEALYMVVEALRTRFEASEAEIATFLNALDGTYGKDGKLSIRIGETLTASCGNHQATITRD